MANTELNQINSTLRVGDKKNFGGGNTAFITGTKRAVGPFYALTALSECVVDTSECWQGGEIPFKSADALPATITIPIGVTIYGTFADVELDSGTMLGYCLEEPTFDGS